ncbi:acyl-CoA thioesterase [Afipia sp. P52-10]|uniref:thioesterase family protein n=1 Tax=Afipia sp. P52-10 TaxID=1429916 RepID=UPI0003DEF550|nr:thioesterase family protein [Afipia sp. P52-10]ETR76786.1 acyl-CoA thioesterase [Afipia sp. P52-10]
MDTVYRLDGSCVTTGPMAGGPWDKTMQHGSAPSALIVAMAEAVPTAVPMRIARLTVDLMRPVPVAPLEAKTEVLREGRKIQLCNIDLIADGKLAVRGTVLRIRRAAYDLGDAQARESVTLPGPEQGHIAQGKITDNPFMACLSMSVVKGGFNKPGPGAAWFRVTRPIVAGQDNSAAMRAVIAADFCNGLSSVLDFRSWTFLNGDLQVTLARDPVGDWVLLDAETWLGPDGSGIASGKLADAGGYFGRAAQSILIEPRSR